jgi:hypothetical protein
MRKQVVGGKLLRAADHFLSLFWRYIDNYDTEDLVNRFSWESSKIFVYCLSLKDFYISKSLSSDKFFGNDSFDVTETQNYASTLEVEGEVLDEKISRHHHFRVNLAYFVLSLQSWYHHKAPFTFTFTNVMGGMLSVFLHHATLADLRPKSRLDFSWKPSVAATRFCTPKICITCLSFQYLLPAMCNPS